MLEALLHTQYMYAGYIALRMDEEEAAVSKHNKLHTALFSGSLWCIYIWCGIDTHVHTHFTHCCTKLSMESSTQLVTRSTSLCPSNNEKVYNKHRRGRYHITPLLWPTSPITMAANIGRGWWGLTNSVTTICSTSTAGMKSVIRTGITSTRNLTPSNGPWRRLKGKGLGKGGEQVE